MLKGNKARYKKTDISGVIVRTGENMIKMQILRETHRKYQVVGGSTVEDKEIHFERIVDGNE